MLDNLIKHCYNGFKVEKHLNPNNFIKSRDKEKKMNKECVEKCAACVASKRTEKAESTGHITIRIDSNETQIGIDASNKDVFHALTALMSAFAERNEAPVTMVLELLADYVKFVDEDKNKTFTCNSLDALEHRVLGSSITDTLDGLVAGIIRGELDALKEDIMKDMSAEDRAEFTVLLGDLAGLIESPKKH